MKLIVGIVVLVLALPPWAAAFHDLDCGPMRASVIDPKTGQRKCLEQSPDVRKQFLRQRKLQQEQENRVRDLQLQQLQRSKAQQFLERQTQRKQQQFNRQQTEAQQRRLHRQQTRQQQPDLARGRTIRAQESLKRQDLEAARRREQIFKNALERQGNLLEQKIVQPKADLLDRQKEFNRRLKKEQKG